MARRHTNKLLVEGNEDKFTIASLMSHHIRDWGDNRDNWKVLIEEQDGVESLLADGVIPTYLKSSEVDILGITIDANDDCAGRWNRIRDLCVRDFPDFPERLPEDGLIINNPEGKCLGVWIMPDNRGCGMLETFLRLIVPNQNDPLWLHAQKTCLEAKSKGAQYIDKHQDKANIHTWLAWQDPPGQSLGIAVKSKCLNPASPYAVPYVEWFKRLYKLK